MSARPRNRRPEVLSSLVHKVLEELGLDQASQGALLMRDWDNGVGPALAPHCRPEGLRKDVVHARVRDSAWMQRIQMEKPRILAGLRALLEHDALSLRMRIGPLDD